MKKFGIDMSKLFPPAAHASDTFPKSLPADVVSDVLSDIGLGAPKAPAGGIDPLSIK